MYAAYEKDKRLVLVVGHKYYLMQLTLQILGLQGQYLEAMFVFLHQQNL